MSRFLEDPMPIILFGILVEAVLAVVLARTGRGVLLWAMGGVLAMVVLGVVIEQLVVTERERIEAVLEEAAAAIEANDMKQLEPCLSASASQTRSRAIWVFNTVRFFRVKITDIDIGEINRHTSPPTVKTTVYVVFTAQDRAGTIGPETTRPIKLGVELRREGDHWKITRHTEDQSRAP